MLIIIKDKVTNKQIMSMSATEENKNKIIETLIENAINIGITEYLIEESDRTQEEIEEEQNKPQPPSDKERIEQLENMILMMLGGEV